MFVKPAPGLRIPDPAQRDYLPDAGRDVQDAPYWRRRLHDGDVIEAKPAPEKPVGAVIAAPATRSDKE